MRSLNIWLMQTGEPLPINNNVRKMRTAILADKLAAKGHNVLWWASALNHANKSWMFKEDTEVAIKDNLKIMALKGTGYKKNISPSRYLDHRVIARKFKLLAPKLPKPDIIIASTPPYDLAFESVVFAKKSGSLVLVDIRDQWPDLFLNHIPKGFQKTARLMLHKDFLMIEEALQMADGLIAVTDTLLEWGLRYAEREKNWQDKIFYLGYKKPRASSSAEPNKITKLIDGLGQKFIVTFIGTFGYYNNPHVLIECAKRVTNKDIHFILAGDGESFEELKRAASQVPNVTLVGWLDQHEIATLLEHAHVGVYPITKDIEAFPNKVFAYLSAGLPVVSVFQKELHGIIESNQIGFSYPPQDTDKLIGYIERLSEDKVLHKRLSNNALKAFTESYDADRVYDQYVDHIEMLAYDKVLGNSLLAARG